MHWVVLFLFSFSATGEAAGSRLCLLLHAVTDATLAPQPKYKIDYVKPGDRIGIAVENQNGPVISLAEVRAESSPAPATDAIVARREDGTADSFLGFRRLPNGGVSITSLNATSGHAAEHVVKWLIANNPASKITIAGHVLSPQTEEAILSQGFNREDAGTFVRPPARLRVVESESAPRPRFRLYDPSNAN